MVCGVGLLSGRYDMDLSGTISFDELILMVGQAVLGAEARRMDQSGRLRSPVPATVRRGLLAMANLSIKAGELELGGKPVKKNSFTTKRNSLDHHTSKTFLSAFMEEANMALTASTKRGGDSPAAGTSSNDNEE